MASLLLVGFVLPFFFCRFSFYYGREPRRYVGLWYLLEVKRLWLLGREPRRYVGVCYLLEVKRLWLLGASLWLLGFRVVGTQQHSHRLRATRRDCILEVRQSIGALTIVMSLHLVVHRLRNQPLPIITIGTRPAHSIRSARVNKELRHLSQHPPQRITISRTLLSPRHPSPPIRRFPLP